MILVQKEILVHKASRVIPVHRGHLVVVVLGLRVLKVSREIQEREDQKEVTVFRIQKVTKEILVLRVLGVIKMTLVLQVEKVIKGKLEHKDLRVMKVIQDHRGHLVVVILQTFELFYYFMELR